jgi:hypothetical protein
MNKKFKIETWMREQDDIWAPSRHHGEAIDYAISKMEDDDYVIHIDCDCIMLMRNWGSLIAHLLKEYDHVSCVRPLIKHLDTGPWFTAFQVKNIRNHNITFMPKIDDEGKDLKCKSRYDVGSDLIRMGDNWKKIESIKNSKKYGNIWAIDEAILMAHMGKASHGRGGNFLSWKKYIYNEMKVKYGRYNMNKKIFNLTDKQASSEGTGDMTKQYIMDINSLSMEISNLEEILADNSDPWVIDHLATAVDDLREVVNFLKSKSQNEQ